MAEQFDSLDLLVLASPPQTHLEHGLAALRAGLAIVVDKPFVRSVAEAEALVAASEESGRPLIVFHNRRWDGDFLTVKRVLESGALGEVFGFESSFEHWAPTTDGGWKDTSPISEAGGITFDLGSHLIDQALQLFGPVADVGATLRTVRSGGGNDDVSLVELVHESGVHSLLRMSRVGAQWGPRFRVSGTRGAYVSSGLDGQEPALAAGVLPTNRDYGVTPESGWGRLGVSAPGQPEPVAIPTERGNYPAFYAGVADAVLGRGPSPVSARSALDVVAVLERIRDSAAS
jgi:predicted dehydrogenase